jgi:hypothetical protein
MANNYKVPGKKMTSRFNYSDKDMREMIKKGLLPGAEEIRSCGRDPSYSAKQWRKLQRMSRRQSRVYERSLPIYDMDGGYYHG